MIDIIYIKTHRPKSFTRYFEKGIGKTASNDYSDIDSETANYLRFWINRGYRVLYRTFDIAWDHRALARAMTEFRAYPGYANIGCIVMDHPQRTRGQYNSLLVEWRNLNRMAGIHTPDEPILVLGQGRRHGGDQLTHVIRYVHEQLLNASLNPWSSDESRGIFCVNEKPVGQSLTFYEDGSFIRTDRPYPRPYRASILVSSPVSHPYRGVGTGGLEA